MKRKFQFGIYFIILVGLILWDLIALMPLNIRYTETVFILLVIIGVVMFINLPFELFETTEVIVNGRAQKQFKLSSITNFIKTFGILILIFIVHANGSLPIFFSSQYQELIGEVHTEDFTKEFSAVSTDHLPIVDHNLAVQLGDKKLGSTPGLGSEFHVGEFSDIDYNGHPYAVAPLEYNDIFKWMNNASTGVPGYIMVDKVTGDVELVDELDGETIGLKYLESAYFHQDLARVAYLNGNWDNTMYKSYFEIDNDGHPYFVIPKTHKTIGINGGDDVYEVVTVDAQTGKVNTYDVSEAPEWIDNIYPKELVITQINDYGIYVNGFFNTLFTQKDIIQTTYGSRRVFNNGKMYHYTGLTSAGSDESTVGFMFVNTRTKDATLYSITGATENAAMKSAEGVVQDFGYYATFPVPLNVGGVPTFMITLKDDTGLIKQYSYVNINSYNIVGNGVTLSAAESNYIKALGNEYDLESENLSFEEVTGTVARIGINVENGDTEYVLVLADDNKYYFAASTVNDELAVTIVGDKVKINVIDNKIIIFDNLNLK